MAEQTQTTELASKPSINTGGGLISNIGDTLERIKRFSNEPAVQRSIPVIMVTASDEVETASPQDVAAGKRARIRHARGIPADQRVAHGDRRRRRGLRRHPIQQQLNP